MPYPVDFLESNNILHPPERWGAVVPTLPVIQTNGHNYSLWALTQEDKENGYVLHVAPTPDDPNGYGIPFRLAPAPANDFHPVLADSDVEECKDNPILDMVHRAVAVGQMGVVYAVVCELLEHPQPTTLRTLAATVPGPRPGAAHREEYVDAFVMISGDRAASEKVYEALEPHLV